MSNFSIGRLKQNHSEEYGRDVVILAAGFEERAIEYLSLRRRSETSRLILLTFQNDVPGNDSIGERYRALARKKFQEDHIQVVELVQNHIHKFRHKLRDIVLDLPLDIDRFIVDISGMPGFMIFAALDIVRESRPYQSQTVIYTSAAEYTPTKAEFESLSDKQGDDIEFIPKSMALEMSENLIFEPFSGYRSSSTKTCLALFAGYEPHRSTGVVDAINPAMLLLLYGEPADPTHSWRLQLSRKLHNKFEKTRRCAIEIVPTRDVEFCVAKLEEYYNFLVDDYDLTLAAVCSKMQTIASFVFWERYPEVQVTFPLPIGYDPRRRPSGVEATYELEMPGRLTFSKPLSV